MEQLELLGQLHDKSSLTEIQEYTRKILDIRGFSHNTIEEEMLLLLEEVGELAKAVRKASPRMNIDIERMQNYDTIESEAADIFIVLMKICNMLDISLFEALVAKEKINCGRKWGAL